MKSHFFISTLICIYILSLAYVFPVYALDPGRKIDSGLDYAVGAPVPTKNAAKTYDELIRGFFRTPIRDKSNSSLTPTTPPNTTTPGATTPTAEPSTPIGTAFKYYRQCDYRSTRLRDGGSECTMCKAGCGITAAAGVLSTLLDPKLDPPTVLQKYTALGHSSGCGGTTMTAAKNVIESYGLHTSATYLFGTNSGYTIEQVAPDIREKVKNGWYVFVLGNFCSGGCGHFFVITDIDSANNVTSFDPYYFDASRYPPASTSQPITYSRIKPYPMYRYGFAVRRIASTISSLPL